MNLNHTELHRFFRKVCRYRKLAGLLVRRPRGRLLCGDCEFCMGACSRSEMGQETDKADDTLARQKGRGVFLR